MTNQHPSRNHKNFELSLMNNLTIIYNSKLFSKHQRGFIKGGRTTDNTIELLKFGVSCQQTPSKHKAAIVFFDIKNAYDSVVRKLLYSKMKQFEINNKIILSIKFMLDSFKLKFGGITINTTRGLVQGSTLSPILFNIYLNDILNQFENEKILSLAFADDIAC